jgi:hypothetical protein
MKNFTCSTLSAHCIRLVARASTYHSSFNLFNGNSWKIKIGPPIVAATLALCGTSRAMADPVSVGFTATNTGGSEWRYDYTLSGSFAAQDDLAIFFPISSSSSLVDLGTGGSDWTTFALQPDSSLPADGEFDMVANLDNPSLTSVFSVDFLYSGAGAPGAQSYTLFDPSFNELASGVTQSSVTSPVPEPASLVLMATGFLGILKIKRRSF